MNGQKGRKLESKWLEPRLLNSLSLLGLIKTVKELYREVGTKKYHLNEIILYIKRKNFEIDKVKVFQLDIRTSPAVIGEHKSGKPGAKALIL